MSRIYQGTCDANDLADGVEIITSEDLLRLENGDQLDVTTRSGKSYSLMMSEPGDLVEGISVQVWTWATIMCGLKRIDRCRFRVSMTEAQDMVVKPHEDDD